MQSLQRKDWQELCRLAERQQWRLVQLLLWVDQARQWLWWQQVVQGWQVAVL